VSSKEEEIVQSNTRPRIGQLSDIITVVMVSCEAKHREEKATRNKTMLY